MGVHRGNKVKIGGFDLFAAGAMVLQQSDIERIAPDVVVDLAAHKRFNHNLHFSNRTLVITKHLQDFGGVSADWSEFVENIAGHLRAGQKVLCFCRGGHGRTGCLLSSLTALLEPDVEDPIAAVRQRYCSHAVETVAQADAVFRLRQLPTPEQYRRSLF
ncbi:hypothetical protein KC887_05560 [Candidatus Kaiserbacteria bacterium]|nr:hypothetical protein [Candidatus Kaiserbacteria bacterium]